MAWPTPARRACWVSDPALWQGCPGGDGLPSPSCLRRRPGASSCAAVPDAATMTNTAWTRLIRDMPDFPKPGIVFKDIMPVLADAAAFDDAIEALAAPWHGVRIDAVLAMEARGFLLGTPLARALGAGIVPLRKPGKLPGRVFTQAYALEYGEDALQVQADALPPGARVAGR